jgi:hypothetical protein
MLCDWVELKALSSPAGQVRLNDVRRLWDKTREREESDPEGLEKKEEDTDNDGVAGGDDDRFFDSVENGVEERLRALGDSYPFKLGAGSKLQVHGPPTDGGYMYLFCLFLSHAGSRELFDGSWFPAVDNGTRDLFQVCSTLAAAAEVKGCAIAFGWPRPGHIPFLAKLRTVYELFGEGKVVEKRKPGVTLFAKDEEIDVIAWRPRPDKGAGTDYLLGQVASGDNWEGKAIKGGPIDNFHNNWFTSVPPSTVRPAIFIPHSVPQIEMEGTRLERLAAITYRYGMVIDRLRLPRATQEGLDLYNERRSGIHIERGNEVSLIRHWVNEQITQLQGASK